MAQYTVTIKQMVESGIKIFDFDYPMFKEEYKPTFEKLFIDYFYFDEIGLETPALFKHRLKTKLNLIMPYYNKLYMSQDLEQRILDNYDVTEIIKRSVKGDSSRELVGSMTSSSTTKNLFKNAPKTKIDVDKFDVVSSLSKDEGRGTSSNNTNEKNKTTNNEEFTRTMKGNIGVQTDADAIVKYWTSLRNVTIEIFENELNQLFMGVF